MSTNQEQIFKLSEKMINRRCYTMKDVIEGRSADDLPTGIVERTFYNPLLEKIRKLKGLKAEHSLQKVDAGALGELSNLVVEAATPDAIGRQIARVVETQKTAVKFRKRNLGIARSTSQGTTTDSKGETPSFTTINTDIELEASEEWTISFIEDAEWDVLSEEAATVGQALKLKETDLILSQLSGITAGDLAGGAEVNSVGGTVIAYADIVDAWGAVKGADRSPDKLVMHPKHMAQLLKDSNFTSSLFFGDYLDKSRGVFGRSILGFDIIVSTRVSGNKAYMIDSRYAVGMPLRRDTLVIPYEGNGKTDAGVKATSRFGLGVLDPAAVSRIDIN